MINRMVRYIKRITPDETNAEYRDGDFINFTLPQNIIDLQSVAMYYDWMVDDVQDFVDDTILKRFLPPNSSAIIDNLQIKINGEIKQTIDEYALLNQMYTDMEEQYINNSDSEKSDTFSHNYIDENNIEVKEVDIINSDELKKTYSNSISKWIGMLNSKNRYLDCRGKNVQITIKLSPKYITYKGIKVENVLSGVRTVFSTDYHFFVSKVFMNMSVIDNENIELNNELLFDNYTHFKSMKNTTSKNAIVRGRVNTNIKYILTTFTDNNRNTDTGLQLEHANEDVAKFGALVKNTFASGIAFTNAHVAGTPTTENYSAEQSKIINKPNQLNNSIYFKRNGIDVKTNQFRINGVEVSPPFTALECFNNIKYTFNSSLSKVKTLSSFINDFFMNVLLYNSTDDKVSEIDWLINGEGRNIGGEGHMFVVSDKTIKI